jgi:hypothetical protein
MSRGFGAAYGVADLTDSVLSGKSFADLPTFSFGAWVYRAANGTTNNRLIEKNTSQFNFYVDLSGVAALTINAATVALGAAGLIPTGRWCHVCVTSDATPTTNLYVDGALVATVAGIVKSTGASNALRVGNYTGLARPWVGYIGDFTFWNGYVLTQGEARALAQGADPLTIRRQYIAEHIDMHSGLPRSLVNAAQPVTTGTKQFGDRFRGANDNRLLASVVPAAGSAVAGTSALTLGQTGAVTGKGATAGSSALSFGQSAAVTGTGATAGTSALTLGQSGAVTGKGATSGTSALTLGQTGAITGTGATSGTSALTLGQTATVSGTGTIAGTSPLSFTALWTVSGATAVSGTSALSFSQSAAVRGSGLLAGTSPLTLGQTGAITGTGTASGTSSITFGQTSAVTGTGSVAGSSPITFAASWTAPGGIAGTSALTFGATGAITGTGLVGGVSSLSFSMSGSKLTGSGTATTFLRLPTLNQNIPIADAQGNPSPEFMRFWQNTVGKIAAAFNATTAANAAAIVANNAAATALNAAQTVTNVSAISNSFVTGVTITATDAGSNVTLTISAHTRVYGDGSSVAVSAGSITGLPYSTLEYVYYDDAARVGGAVTYLATTSSATAAQAGIRHTVGSATTPAALGAPISGKFVRPPGVGAIQ